MGPTYILTLRKTCACPPGTSCNCEEKLRAAVLQMAPKHPRFPHPPRRLPMK